MEYLSIRAILKKYKLTLNTAKKILPYVEHYIYLNSNERIVKCRINSRLFEAFCKVWHIGKFRRSKPDIFDEYVSLYQAEVLSSFHSFTIRRNILRGNIDAIKNPLGEWLVFSPSLRSWTLNRIDRLYKKGIYKEPNYLWLFPPTERKVRLFNEFYYMMEQTVKIAKKRGIQLESDWISKLITAIHDREAKNRM